MLVRAIETMVTMMTMMKMTLMVMMTMTAMTLMVMMMVMTMMMMKKKMMMMMMSMIMMMMMMVMTVMSVMIMVIMMMIRGRVVSKLLSSGRLSWLAVSPSWQPHHHQVVGKRRSGTREFTLEKTLAGVTPCVSSGKVAARGRRWRVSVSAVARFDR